MPFVFRSPATVLYTLNSLALRRNKGVNLLYERSGNSLAIVLLCYPGGTLLSLLIPLFCTLTWIGSTFYCFEQMTTLLVQLSSFFFLPFLKKWKKRVRQRIQNKVRTILTPHFIFKKLVYGPVTYLLFSKKERCSTFWFEYYYWESV